MTASIITKATMKAAVLHAPGDLRIEEVPIPACADDEVLVQVKATGICGSDLDRVMVTGTYHFPTIPGHEFCGVVAKVGQNVTKYVPGDRVAVAPILPCFQCEFCQQGHYGQCNDYNYLGSRTDGGFAEYVAAPERNLVRMLDNISYEHGAMIEPAAVTLHGVMKAGIKAGDSVTVLGCGALGLFAIQFARILGATRIIATDIAEDKLALAKEIGATHVINSKNENAVKAILAQGAVDVTIETAGVAMTQVQALEITQKHGNVLYLGTAHADVVIPARVFEHIIRNELTIIGAWNSFSAPFPGREWSAIIDYIQNGSLNMAPLITHTIALEDIPAFVKDMKNRVVSYNKVIIKM